MSKENSTADREMSITRLLNAPRELVFEVWTNPKHIAQWWGPNGFTNTIHEMNVKPGSKWLFTMHGPDGTDYPNEVVYHEIVKNEKLVYTHGSGIENDPRQFNVIVTFEAQGNKTLLTMRGIFGSKEELDFVIKEHHALEGQKQTINRLEEYLAKMQ